MLHGVLWCATCYGVLRCATVCYSVLRQHVLRATVCYGVLPTNRNHVCRHFSSDAHRRMSTRSRLDQSRISTSTAQGRRAKGRTPGHKGLRRTAE